MLKQLWGMKALEISFGYKLLRYHQSLQEDISGVFESNMPVRRYFIFTLRR